MTDKTRYWQISTLILGILLLAVLIKISTEDGVSSSPTLIINSVNYQSQRTPKISNQQL